MKFARIVSERYRQWFLSVPFNSRARRLHLFRNDNPVY
jgi:hypothetical protein